MRLTVLGGSGAWPVPGQGCSGYLVTHRSTRILLDPGPGTLGELLRLHDPAEVDAVVVSHGHADHVADLASLLRARRFTGVDAPLPVYAGRGVVDAALALDPPHLVQPSVRVVTVSDGTRLDIGDMGAVWRQLPHHLPNLGVRLTTSAGDVVHTGDTGSSAALDTFAAGTDVLLADATYLGVVPDEDDGLLGNAADAGRTAHRAQVGRLVLTHLWPGTDPAEALAAARAHFSGPVDVARPGLVVPVGPDADR